MDTNTMLGLTRHGPFTPDNQLDRLAALEEQFKARRQELIDQANKPADGVGFGPTELALQIALQVEQALAIGPSEFAGMTLRIDVPPGSDLTPLFNNPAGELVIRVRQYTPGPAMDPPAAAASEFPVPEL